MVLNKLNFENVNNTYDSTTMGTVHDLGDSISSHEKLTGIESRVHLVKKMLQVETGEFASWFF